MSEANCIFCKIIGGEIPSKTLFENDEFKVIFDISPASKGHVIILPKYHAANIFELSTAFTTSLDVFTKVCRLLIFRSRSSFIYFTASDILPVCTIVFMLSI